VLTLGVDDLKKALKFYRDGLGLKTEGIAGEEFEYGAVAFFDLENGMKLALWPCKSLARRFRTHRQSEKRIRSHP
jgi:catechol 2,3-dioxygenase-like lactoylglutathione lyase family enzyme